MSRERAWDPDAAPPSWFSRVTRDTGERFAVEVEGAVIRALAWGDRRDPTVVLVHGGAAHAQWWAPLAPFLADHHRVIALDLSGHGDSGRRASYSVATWAAEVLAVAASGGGGDSRPFIVGHSMGGFVTIATAALHGEELEGAVIIDTPVHRPDPETVEGLTGSMFRAPKVYPDLEVALRHFHLVPPQPCANGWLVAHIARHSLHPVDGGVSWKFDPGVFVRREGPNRPDEFGPLLERAACRLAVINGAESAVIDDDTRDYMAELLAGSPAASAGVPFLDVPEAQHHVLLDQPIALVTALRAILGSWHPIGAPPAQVVVDRG